MDIREYDVPYHHRFAIDTETRCGQWYMVRSAAGQVVLSPREDLLLRAEMRVCAFDIECTKLPLQFPNAAHDQARAPRRACVSAVHACSRAHPVRAC